MEKKKMHCYVKFNSKIHAGEILDDKVSRRHLHHIIWMKLSQRVWLAVRVFNEALTHTYEQKL